MDITTFFEWFSSGLAIVGVLLNNKRIRWCFPLWFVSNIICLVLHYQVAYSGMMVRDGVFGILAVHGWFCWRDKK